MVEMYRRHLCLFGAWAKGCLSGNSWLPRGIAPHTSTPHPHTSPHIIITPEGCSLTGTPTHSLTHILPFAVYPPSFSSPSPGTPPLLPVPRPCVCSWLSLRSSSRCWRTRSRPRRRCRRSWLSSGNERERQTCASPPACLSHTVPSAAWQQLQSLPWSGSHSCRVRSQCVEPQCTCCVKPNTLLLPSISCSSSFLNTKQWRRRHVCTCPLVLFHPNLSPCVV